MTKQASSIYNVNDRERVVELKWLMKCVASSYSAKSCDSISELFHEIFPCESSSSFSLSKRKFRYLLTGALGPYFESEILKDIENNYFTLLFDETTNIGNKES